MVCVSTQSVRDEGNEYCKAVGDEKCGAVVGVDIYGSSGKDSGIEGWSRQER